MPLGDEKARRPFPLALVRSNRHCLLDAQRKVNLRLSHRAPATPTLLYVRHAQAALQSRRVQRPPLLLSSPRGRKKSTNDPSHSGFRTTQGLLNRSWGKGWKDKSGVSKWQEKKKLIGGEQMSPLSPPVQTRPIPGQDGKAGQKLCKNGPPVKESWLSRAPQSSSTTQGKM